LIGACTLIQEQSACAPPGSLPDAARAAESGQVENLP
jgi:hypothetical protein